MADATTAQPVGSNTQLPLDIGSIISLITGITGNSGATSIAQSADPWAPNRGAYMDQLNAFMKDPSSVLKDPAFTAAENVGAENISRQAGAAGMANSGNRLADLFTFGQTAGLNFENQKFQQLQQLAGVNAGSPVAAAGLQLGALQNQGTNLTTGLAGVLPMIMQLLGLGGGTPGAGGLVSMLQNMFGGGGGSINPDGSINWGSTGTGPADASGGPGSATDPFAGMDGGGSGPDLTSLFTGSGVDSGLGADLSFLGIGP